MNRSAYALAELIVAITLLSIGLLTASGTALLATRWMGEARAEEIAVTHAMAILDSLAAVPSPASHATHIDGFDVRWTVAPQGGGRNVMLSIALPARYNGRIIEFESYLPRVR